MKKSKKIQNRLHANTKHLINYYRLKLDKLKIIKGNFLVQQSFNHELSSRSIKNPKVYDRFF